MTTPARGTAREDETPEKYKEWKYREWRKRIKEEEDAATQARGTAREDETPEKED